MKVTLDRTENRTIYFIVEPDASELEVQMGKVYKHWVNRIEIPDLPKGDIPRDVFEKHVGREEMIKEVLTEMAHATSSKVIKEYNIKNWLQPMATILQYEPPKFEIAVPLEPIVEIVDYHSIKIEQESLEVKEEEVDKILEKSRLQLATLTSVDRPVKEGDFITIDIEGTESGSVLIHNKSVKFQVVPEFAPDMPGLYKMMVGIKKGEENRFKLKLPENITNIRWAGKEVDFIVRVYDINEPSFPEIDDAFARKLAPGVQSLDILKKRIRFNLKKEKEQNADPKFKEKIVETLIEKSRVEYPALMIDIEAKKLIEDYNRQLRSSCKDEKEYEEKMKQTSIERIRENAKSLARKRISWSIVLDKVAQVEGIDVNDDEIAAEIDKMTQNLEEQEQKKERRNLHRTERENVIDILKVRKTINKLAEIVQSSN